MTRTVYLNGDYLPETGGQCLIFDRGYAMATRSMPGVTSVLAARSLNSTAISRG